MLIIGLILVNLLVSCQTASSLIEDSIIFVPDLPSVSYTHLDVYKRQVLELPNAYNI